MKPPRLDRLVLAADLAGTAVFAAEGALMAMAARLDLLGIAVLGFVTASGGGILRDMLLGDLPPAALRDQRYPIAALLAAGVAILLRTTLRERTDILLTLDAAGLALFAVAGTEKALLRGGGSLTAAMLGTVTATGGGVMRDVLLAGVPTILRADFYATAALAGAIVLLAGRAAGVPARVAALLGGGACFALRMLGARLHWHLPSLG